MRGTWSPSSRRAPSPRARASASDSGVSPSSASSRVISIIVRRNPAFSNIRWATALRSAVESTARGSPRAASADCVASSKRGADPLPAVIRIDHQIVNHAGRAAQRHIVVPLDPGIGIADHRAVPLRDQNELVRLFTLRAEKAAIKLGHVRSRREEAPGVEFVMLRDQHCAKAADRGHVGGLGGTDSHGSRHGRRFRSSGGCPQWTTASDTGVARTHHVQRKCIDIGVPGVAVA